MWSSDDLMKTAYGQLLTKKTLVAWAVQAIVARRTIADKAIIFKVREMVRFGNDARS